MKLTFTIPDDVWESMRLPEKDKQEHILIELAVILYQRGILSFGKSRALANLTKWEFDDELGRRKIERHYGEEDIDHDKQYAQG